MKHIHSLSPIIYCISFMNLCLHMLPSIYLAQPSAMLNQFTYTDKVLQGKNRKKHTGDRGNFKHQDTSCLAKGFNKMIQMRLKNMKYASQLLTLCNNAITPVSDLN